MKKIFLAAFIFLGFSFFLTAQTAEPSKQKTSFYLELKSSYKNQIFRDYLFDSPDLLNSRLDWDADYLFYLGLTGGMKIKGLELFVSTDFTLPFECGHMYDSDWRTPGMKTNFSISDLYPAFGNDSLIGIKYHFLPGKNQAEFFISPVLIISNSYMRYNAKNTIGWCGDIKHTGLTQNYPWDSEYATKWRKYGIDLTNNITSVFCGLELSKKIRAFEAAGGILVSPYTYIFSIDHHLNSGEGKYYLMIQEAWFSVLDFYLSTGYSINKKNQIILSAQYSFCPRIDGEMYFGYNATNYELTIDISGFSFNKFTTTLSWRLSFGD